MIQPVPFTIRLAAAVVAAVALVSMSSAQTARGAVERVYIGAYTQNPSGGPGRGGVQYTSQGIYQAEFNLATGKLGPVTLAAKTVNPSYLVISPDGRFVYAVNELTSFEGQPNTGGITAFAVNPATGVLTQLNQVASGGTLPCYLSFDKTGKHLMVANYGTGSVAIFALNSDGSLGRRTAFMQHQGHSVNPRRQAGPHAHFAQVSPDNRYLLSVDLGLDQILVSKFDARTGTVTPNDPPYVSVTPGTGPRHFVWADNGHRLYAVSELGSTAFGFDYNQGKLSQFQSQTTMPPGFKGSNSGAEIQISPDGRFIYTSNRGANTIAQFAIAPKTGRFSLVQDVSTQGKNPRMFQLDPSGGYVWAGNQDSANVVVFKRDAASGKLTPAGINIPLSMPVCIQFWRLR